MAQPPSWIWRQEKAWISRGTRRWGYAYNSLMKQKCTAYLPEPSTELS